MSRTHQKDSYWLEVFEQYRASNKTQRAFCLQNNYKYPQFKYYWEKLVQKPSRDQMKAPNDFIPISIQSPTQKPTKSESTHTAEAVIELPNGVRCTLTVGTDAVELSTLLKQLVTLC